MLLPHSAAEMSCGSHFVGSTGYVIVVGVQPPPPLVLLLVLPPLDPVELPTAPELDPEPSPDPVSADASCP
jgi:hypothetical protein